MIMMMDNVNLDWNWCKKNGIMISNATPKLSSRNAIFQIRILVFMDPFLRQRCAIDRADGCNYWDQKKMKLRICAPNSSPIFTMSLCRSDHCDIYPLSLRDFSPFSSPVYFPSANQKSSFSKYFIPFPPSFFKLNMFLFQIFSFFSFYKISKV